MCANDTTAANFYVDARASSRNTPNGVLKDRCFLSYGELEK